MALIGNRSVIHKSPARFLAGTVASIDRSNFNKHGMMRGNQAAFGSLAAVPSGNNAPSAWVLPRKAGALSSRNFATLTLSGGGLAVGGVTTTGAADITIAFADAAGQLIASGDGTASFTLTTNTPLLTASINGIGTASFVVSTNTPLLGAIASGGGTSIITLSVANATIYPLNDASPLRTGATSFAINGTLTPYAIGQMVGSTTDASIITNDSISAAVWAKIIEAGYSAEQILRIIAAHAAGAATGLEGANPQFTGLDGLSLRIDGTYAAGTRTIDSLNGDV